MRALHNASPNLGHMEFGGQEQVRHSLGSVWEMS